MNILLQVVLSDTFKKMRVLLKDKKNWSRFGESRNPRSEVVKWDDLEANQWSLNGAILKVSNGDAQIFREARILIQDKTNMTVGGANNSFSHTQILNLIDKIVLDLDTSNHKAGFEPTRA